MILKAKHNCILYPFFKWYTRLILKRNFSKVTINGCFNDRKRPVLLISNHISWWDGFWAAYLNMKMIKRKFHFMMLEDQLRKYWFFNHIGGFSISPMSKNTIETLKYTNELLSDESNIVLMFPQGEIQSMHQQSFVFARGIEMILNHQLNSVQVIFVANLVDYFSKPKPSVNIYIKEYESLNHRIDEIKNKYDEFYRQCLQNQLQLKA
jgi:1-acyl-sn-glycerol-3-phosphate acyltransferase